VLVAFHKKTNIFTNTAANPHLDGELSLVNIQHIHEKQPYPEHRDMNEDDTDDTLVVPIKWADLEVSSTLVSHNEPLRTNDMKYTDRETVMQVYALGRALTTIFEECRISYWASGGTCLGAVRHRGLIPWDDDLDLCTLASERELLDKAGHRFTVSGIHHETTMFGLRLFQDQSRRYPFCDVFVMTLDKQRVVCKYPGARKTYPKEIYKLANVEDPQVARFGDFQINIPRSPETYLTKYYGPDWNKVAKTQDYCHITKSSLESVSYSMEEEMFTPALPFS